MVSLEVWETLYFMPEFHRRFSRRKANFVGELVSIKCFLGDVSLALKKVHELLKTLGGISLDEKAWWLSI